jgi:predicted  nucleic acid-binding Zn-ribbon protein
MTGAWAQEASLPVTDLGQRQMGQRYPIKLTAINIDCQSAQDFEFEISNAPWLVTPANPIVSGLGPGQSGTIAAQLDFTYMAAGTYYGRVTARCITCGWFIFAACMENGQDVVLKVDVVDPQRSANAPVAPAPQNPFANQAPATNALLVLDPRISNQDESLLTREQKYRLRIVRDAIKTAEQNGTRARAAVQEARRKKNNCERELARLKAALNAAMQKAATANQDVANANAAARAAKQALADYAQDVDKARHAKVQAERDLKMAIGARQLDAKRYGAGSPRYAAATDRIAAMNDKSRAANAEYTRVNGSTDARKKAADQVNKQVQAEQAKARAAQAGTDQARNAYNAKARECHALGLAKADADKKLQDAKDAAKHAVGVANYEEAEARKKAALARNAAAERGAKKLKEDIERAKKQKKKCEAEVKRYANYLTRMFKAIRDLTNMNKRKVTDEDLNVEVTAIDMAKEFLSSTASNLLGEINPLPTGETAFTTLKAGYDIIKFKQMENTSGRGIFRGNDILGDKLKAKGYAKNKAEANRMALDMERFVKGNGNSVFFRQELRDKILRCHKLGERIKELEAQRAAAKASKK